MWVLSSQINERGFHVDRQFAEAARRIAQAAGPEIDAELAELTDGAVTGINQVSRLLKWLQAQGLYDAVKLDRGTLERLLEEESCLQGAPRAGAPARRCPRRRQENRCPACPCRRRRSRAWRLPVSRRRHRPLERRRFSAAKPEASRCQRSRRCHRRSCDRRLRACEEALSAAARRRGRLQPIDDQCGGRARSDRRRFQLDRKPHSGGGCR